MVKSYEHILGVVSLAGAVIGSYLIAANIQLNAYGYAFFLASSITTATLLFMQEKRQWYLITQNVYFTAVNVMGLVNYA